MSEFLAMKYKILWINYSNHCINARQCKTVDGELDLLARWQQRTIQGLRLHRADNFQLYSWCIFHPLTKKKNLMINVFLNLQSYTIRSHHQKCTKHARGLGIICHWIYFMRTVYKIGKKSMNVLFNSIVLCIACVYMPYLSRLCF